MRIARAFLIGMGVLCTACGDEAGGPAAAPGRLSFAVAPSLAPLSQVPVPQPVGGDISNQQAAVALGKALFWDVQVSSDGQVSCGSCHWNAGADDHPVSTGIVPAVFVAISPDPSQPADICAPVGSTRRQTSRTAPPAIGAVFFRDNFWDGRANHIFNDGGAIDNASLASQAVGPPLSPEMSCAGRPFNGTNSVAAKLVASPPLGQPRRPLGTQLVHPDDAVLGALSRFPEPGLNTTYRELIAAAFGTQIAADAENHFSRILAQAIQAYESTLIPDQTPLDRFVAGDPTALTGQQQLGLSVFTGKGNCSSCHAGPELSDATFTFINAMGLINGDGGDQGFHNIGASPTAADLGRAPFSVSGSSFDRGAFKTPALRNVGLTAPYFHDGSRGTLSDVVAFYARGGDFANPERASLIRPLDLSTAEIDALVDFLANGLTDCRVTGSRAPFDHPEQRLTDGRVIGPFGRQGNPNVACP